jgi:histidyl-tRNA synthetase
MAKALGNKNEIPAVGFAFGAERLIEAIIDTGVKLRNKDGIHLYFIQLGDDAKRLMLPISIEARNKGLNSLLSLGTPSLKVQMKKANKLGARFVAIVGIMEAKKGVCQLKDMLKGTQIEVKVSELLDTILTHIDPKELDFYVPAKDWVIVEPITPLTPVGQIAPSSDESSEESDER